MGEADIRALSRKMTDIRAGLLRDRPFYGRLLLHLQFGYAPCGTAYTDMRHIVFDPAFAESLGDEELRFVLLHELMHQCYRSRLPVIRPDMHALNGQSLIIGQKFDL